MKKYFTYSILMIILTIIFAGSLNAIAAPTEEPTTGNTAAVKNTPTTEPTPFINEIGSIGDFNLKAAYEDNAPFEDNMAVNVRTIRENHEMDLIIHAVRTVERDHDIFSMFHIVLQKNGRDIELTKRMNIRIEQSGNFADYDNISVFQIDAAGSAQNWSRKQKMDIFVLQQIHSELLYLQEFKLWECLKHLLKHPPAPLRLYKMEGIRV